MAVVGGGVAGLTAALELRKLNHDAWVFEASPRWGGRIRTARFDDRTYAELGAMRIPEDHVGVLDYIDEFQLGPCREFVHLNGAGWLKFRDMPRTRLRSFWDVLPAYPNLRMRQRRLPTDAWNRLTKTALKKGLRSPSWWDLFRGEISDSDWRIYESMTLWQYTQGHTLYRRSPLLNDDEWEWIGRGSGLYWFETGSLLEHLVEVGALMAPRKYEIPGGMERLVEALVDALGDRLRLSSRVEEIRYVGNLVQVDWRDQFGRHADNFHYVICAIPAPALLKIVADANTLPTALREALGGVRYESAAKTVVHCRRRLWEIDDGIAGGASFTDMPIQQCWYPSDNARQMTQVEEEALVDTTRAVMLNPDATDAEAVPIAWTWADREVAEGPGAFVAAYMWGANAERFAALTAVERDQMVVKGLKILHPGIEKEIDAMEHVSWDQEPVPGGGAFAFFRPGEFSRYQQRLIAPVPDLHPRIFFAGEHLAVLHAWIQSSIQTAWAAVEGVVSSNEPVIPT